MKEFFDLVESNDAYLLAFILSYFAVFFVAPILALRMLGGRGKR